MHSEEQDKTKTLEGKPESEACRTSPAGDFLMDLPGSQKSDFPQNKRESKKFPSPVIPLRPLAFGEIFGGALRIIRRYPALVLGISALIALLARTSSYFLDKLGTAVPLPNSGLDDPAAVIQQLLHQISAMNGTDIAVAAAEFLVTVATDAFLAGFLIVLVGKAVLGRPVIITEIVSEVSVRLMPLIIVAFVYQVLQIIGFICFVVPAIWLSVIFMFATSVLMLERSSIGQAFGRSFMVILGSWFRNFGVLLVCGLIYAFADLALHAVFRGDPGALVGSLSVATTAAGDHSLSQAALGFLTDVLVAPLMVCSITVSYLDQRMRKENLASELQRSLSSEPLR